MRAARRLDVVLSSRTDRLRRERRDRTVICITCGLTGGPFEPAEAAFLIALHDELHHGLRRPAPPQQIPGAVDRAS